MKRTKVPDAIAYLIIGLALGVAISLYVRGSDQQRNMIDVGEWIASQSSTWQQKIEKNPEFGSLSFEVGTVDDGVLIIRSENHLSEKSELILYRYLITEKCPRPLRLIMSGRVPLALPPTDGGSAGGG